MKKKGILIIIISLLTLFLSAKLFIPREINLRGSGGWGVENKYSRMYNPKTVEIIKGKAASIHVITPIRGMYQGVCVMVKNGKEIIPIHLGPEWYVENQDLAVEPSDTIEITGSRINLDGESAIIASEIKKGDKRMVLRDDKGFPRWSAWRSAAINN